MDITITPEKTLKEISEEFQSQFPYLKLHFYTEKHGVKEHSSLWDTLNMELNLKQVGSEAHGEKLHVSGDKVVKDLEQEFQDLFGIGMQVMRRKGRQWIQTITSDERTLDETNRIGQEEGEA